MKRMDIRKKVLALFLIFAMLLGNSSMAVFADVIGNVTQKTEEEEEPNERLVYRYSDANVTVTATLSSADAVPDDAEFVVTELSGAIHDTYMAALNENADTIAANSAQEEAVEYTDENTLLYDMAFMVDAVDEEGNAIEGQKVEYQPAEGTVSLSVKFRQAQLSDGLEAETADDITVIHMPLDEDVKEAADSTLEANASVSDIQVEVVDSAVTLGSSTDRVSMSVSDFSVFVFNNNGEGQKNTWEGTTTFTVSDIISGLGVIANYGVAAKEYTSGDHIESNAYIGTFNITGGGAVLNEASNLYTYNKLSKINVSKTVTNGKDGIFYFAFFEGSTQIGPEFSIETKELTGEISIARTDDTYKAVFDALDSGKTLYLYELDESKQPVMEGGKNGDYTVNYSYSSGNGIKLEEIENTTYTNYIGEFVSTSKLQVDKSFFRRGKIYVGSKPHTVDGGESDYIYLNSDNTFCVMHASTSDFTYVEGLKETINQNIDNVNVLSANLANAKNGDTATNGGTLSVINLISTTGNLSGDLAAANFTGEYIDGMISGAESLLVNIDVSGLSSYTLNGQDIKYDGQNPQDWYNYLGSHVIYNFVTKNEDGSYSPYSGKINISGNASGAMIAPSASVDQSNGKWEGTIVAASLTHSGQEIHKTPLVDGTEYEVNVSCGNVGPTTTTESTTEATTEATTEGTTATTETSTETTTETSTTGTTETATTVTTKDVTTESTTEHTTEATTEQTTEATTEHTTEATTERTTEATTERTTEATTERTTEATTEETTEETSTTTTEDTTTTTEESTTETTEESTTETTEESTTETTEESTTETTTESTTETTTETTVTTETSTETTTEETDMSISITKGLSLNGEGIRARSAVYYVALYEDADCTRRVSDVVALTYENASTAGVTFENLEDGKTYYISECDASGVKVEAGMTDDGTIYAPYYSEGNSLTVSETDNEQTLYFENEFGDLPDGYDRIGKLTVTKKLVSSTGEALDSDETFYAGVFADPEHTQLYSADQITMNVIPISLYGGSEASVTVDVALPESGSVTLYVTETDADGNPVAEAADFQYDVTVAGAEVIFSLDSQLGTVEITNTKRSEEEEENTETLTSTPAPTQTTGVRTGDDTPTGLYFGLLAAAAAVLAGGSVYRRRRNSK